MIFFLIVFMISIKLLIDLSFVGNLRFFSLKFNLSSLVFRRYVDLSYGVVVRLQLVFGCFRSYLLLCVVWLRMMLVKLRREWFFLRLLINFFIFFLFLGKQIGFYLSWLQRLYGEFELFFICSGVKWIMLQFLLLMLWRCFFQLLGYLFINLLIIENMDSVGSGSG